MKRCFGHPPRQAASTSHSLHQRGSAVSLPTPNPDLSDFSTMSGNRVGHDIAEPVLRIDTVVAGIDIAVVLDARPTGRTVLAWTQTGEGLPIQALSAHSKFMTKILPTSLTDPLFVDGDQEVAVSPRDQRDQAVHSLLLFLCQAPLDRQGEDPMAHCRASDRRSTIGCELDEFHPFGPCKKRYTSRGRFAVSRATQASTLYSTSCFCKSLRPRITLVERPVARTGRGDTGHGSPSVRPG